MIGRLGGMLCCLTLGACGFTSASPPSSSNPAHCIAAFHYGRIIAVRARPVKVELAVQSTARWIFEARKLKAHGQSTSGREEGQALLDKHAGDEKVMFGLLRDCGLKQDADPEYRAVNGSGALMVSARRIDPACQEDAVCQSRIR